MLLKQAAENILFAAANTGAVIALKREKEAAKLLMDNSLTISCAESCTGGLISSRLTDVSGSSAYIMQNFITYSNDAKMQLLGVKAETLEKYGAVSAQTALEMAQGLIKKYNCSIALSITGNAGPVCSENKPAGLVYISIADKNRQEVYKYEASPMLFRRFMKYSFSNKALDYLIEFLKKGYKADS